MNPNKKIILCLVVTVFLFVSLSGCILEDLFSTDIGTTSFSLNSWYVCDDDGFPGINLVFSCSDYVIIKLFDPNNVQIDSDYFFNGKKEAVFHLSSYGEIVTPGSYNLRVYDKNNDWIYQNSFSFEGSDLSILSCDQKWWERESYIGGYTLIGLNMMVKNKGDTPVYPYKVDMVMDSSSFSGVVLPAVVLPGGSQEIDCVIYKHGATENFTVTLEDRYGNVIGSDSFSAKVVGNVTVEEFSWSYDDLNRRPKIPMDESLYDYYNSLDRVQHEDYGLYIFDPYDDPYIDLLVDSIMFGFTSDNDVEKINYAASFVQHLEYKKDSDADSSYEYPRYPVETLFNGGSGGGDCEDTAILTACILDNMGYTVALIRLSDHMAVGVSLSENMLPDYEYYTGSYYFLETTKEGKHVGFVPNEYKSSTEIEVFPISSKPLLIHRWRDNNLTIYTKTDIGDFVKVTIVVENLGRINAKNVNVEGAFYTENGLELNTKMNRISFLEPYTKKEITLKADIPKTMKTWFKTRIYFDGEMVDEKKSASPFPT